MDIRSIQRNENHVSVTEDGMQCENGSWIRVVYVARNS